MADDSETPLCYTRRSRKPTRRDQARVRGRTPGMVTRPTLTRHAATPQRAGSATRERTAPQSERMLLDAAQLDRAAAPSLVSTSGDMLLLQRTVGNQAVERLIAGGLIQRADFIAASGHRITISDQKLGT